MGMLIQVHNWTADSPKAKRPGKASQSVYAAVNGHAQAIIVAPAETIRPRS